MQIYQDNTADSRKENLKKKINSFIDEFNSLPNDASKLKANQLRRFITNLEKLRAKVEKYLNPWVEFMKKDKNRDNMTKTEIKILNKGSLLLKYINNGIIELNYRHFNNENKGRTNLAHIR